MSYTITLLRVWQECLDFRNEGAISVDDFFDHLQEKKSNYGLWLFSNVDVSPHDKISFSGYMHVIIYFSLLGKLDVLKMIFKLGCKWSTAYLERDDWESLVDIMLANENVQYSRKNVITAFDNCASSDIHGNKILFFEDLRRVSCRISLEHEMLMYLCTCCKK